MGGPKVLIQAAQRDRPFAKPRPSRVHALKWAKVDPVTSQFMIEGKRITTGAGNLNSVPFENGTEAPKEFGTSSFLGRNGLQPLKRTSCVATT